MPPSTVAFTLPMSSPLVGSGTFGCVISPNIKCQNKAQYKNVGIEDKNLISKLSTYKYYDSENLETVYDEINIGKRIK